MSIAAGDEIRGLAGTYRVVAQHGEGSFGVTYRAVDVSKGDEVIVKQLRIEKLDDWKALDLFEREGRVLASVSHPNIPAFRDFFAYGASAPLPVSQMSAYSGGERLSLVLVQQFVDGSTLQQRVDQGRRLHADEAAAILRPLLEALRHLHEHDPPLIHRDIKPGNIIVTPDGRPFLVDFGAIQDHLRSAGSVGSTIVGTLGYMPLEQTRGQARPASDLYALGVTMIVALAGQPLEELAVDESTGKLAIDEALPRGTPKALRDVLDGMIALLVGQRIQSASEVLERLDRPPKPPRREQREQKERVERAFEDEASPASKGDVKDANASLWSTASILAGACAVVAMGIGAVAGFSRSSRAPRPAAPVATTAARSTPAPTAKTPAPSLAADTKACANGDGAACTRNGRVYSFGQRGVLSDEARGADLFRRACGFGDAAGCNLLGWRYLRGQGITKDLDLAAAALDKSCKAGSPSGCDSYAFVNLNALGMRRDEPAALKLFTWACASGVYESCGFAGFMYAYGRGAPKNEDKAMELYARFCSGLTPDAVHRCNERDSEPEYCALAGLQLTTGACGRSDSVQGAELLSKGCAQGWTWACEVAR